MTNGGTPEPPSARLSAMNGSGTSPVAAQYAAQPRRPSPLNRRANAKHAGIREQHQRQQASHLAVLWQLAMELSSQADCLRGELDPLQCGTGAFGVALVKNEVQHTQNRRHSCGGVHLAGACGTRRHWP